jgi:hypothetical protein
MKMVSLTALAASPRASRAAFIETPVDVDAASGLFGVLTCPRESPRDTGFIFINSGLLHRVGPFRLYVDIARRLAQSGFASIRLDLSGKGDSDALPGVSLAESNIANISAAYGKLQQETGATRFALGGLCSGADDALQAGPECDSLAGIFMFDGYAPKTTRYYINRYGPKFLSARSWLNRIQPISSPGEQSGGEGGGIRNWGTRREMLDRYARLVDQGTHILAIFSGWGGNCYLYPSQLITTINHPRTPNLVSELHFPDATHLFPVSQHRRLAIDGVVDWAERSFGGRT